MAWRWLLERTVIHLHAEQLAEHGGSDGIRDAGLLSSALARPQHRVAYGDPSVFDLAATYAFGIARNHPFVDGNKRTAFLAAYTFLAINGYRLAAPEIEAYGMVMALADGSAGEEIFAAWLGANAAKR